MTHYDVLGVDPSAPASAVRRAYVALARRHHPDRPGGDAEKMRAVNDAWAALGDPARRASYDRSLRDTSSEAEPPDEARRERADPDDLLADLADDNAVDGVGLVVLPRWMSLVPVAAFALSIGLFGVGMAFGSSPAMAASLAVFLLSCALFLAAPFVALLSSRRPGS